MDLPTPLFVFANAVAFAEFFDFIATLGEDPDEPTYSEQVSLQFQLGYDLVVEAFGVNPPTR